MFYLVYKHIKYFMDFYNHRFYYACVASWHGMAFDVKYITTTTTT